ncbi:MAG TPA: hypothetical protein DHW40_00555 [Microbacterium sp.]|nr:hypothetical protein [Microbacterium sp.]
MLEDRYGSKALPTSLAGGGLLVTGLGSFSRLLSIRDDEAWLLERFAFGVYAFAGLLFAAALVSIVFARGRRLPHIVPVLVMAVVAGGLAWWAEVEYARAMTYVP